jgi:hypothetical protein
MVEYAVMKAAEKDFFSARYRETIQEAISTIRNNDNSLLPFDKVKLVLQPNSEHYIGIRTVLISAIVGSEDRYQDFSNRFLPKRDNLLRRWCSIDIARYNNTILPPVKLYEIGGVYFVRDGNHRVSVARDKGVEFIDAEVVRLTADLNLGPGKSYEDIKRELISYEKRQFANRTGLFDLRPDSQIDFSEIGRYHELLDHIEVHKYYINETTPDVIPYEEAVLSWHDNVYRPVVEAIQKSSVLNHFPSRTEADLYIWIVGAWDGAKRRNGRDVPLQQVVEQFTREYGISRWRLVGIAIRSLLRSFLF